MQQRIAFSGLNEWRGHGPAKAPFSSVGECQGLRWKREVGGGSTFMNVIEWKGTGLAWWEENNI